jgi:hypothetical protein
MSKQPPTLDEERDPDRIRQLDLPISAEERQIIDKLLPERKYRLDHSCQVQRHPHAERGHDLYETPAVAVEALLRVERLPRLVWEPAAGRGAIANVLRAHGHDVLASDIVDYGVPGQEVSDFLAIDSGCYPLREGTCIVTNPPFKIAQQFVEHALRLCPKVVMLLRLAFLESERRCDILDDAGLARVWVFRKRLPMTHRDGWEGRKANSGMAFAWMVWERAHRGPAELRRLSWEDDRDARTVEAPSLIPPIDEIGGLSE